MLVDDGEFDGGGGRNASSGDRRLVNDCVVGPLRGSDVVGFATELRDVDSELRSLRNINSPEDYAWALCAAGIN